MASATRTAVTDSVLALLERQEPLTYEAVARRAGVSRQTVYAHFATRADLLVGAVERARELAGVEAGAQAVYEAGTAIGALEAFTDLHGSFVPRFLRAHVAIERERSSNPELEAMLESRARGRSQLAHHVATRLHAEGYLEACWTVDSAGELVAALTSGTFTAHLLDEVRWTPAEVRSRVLLVLRQALVRPREEP